MRNLNKNLLMLTAGSRKKLAVFAVYFHFLSGVVFAIICKIGAAQFGEISWQFSDSFS